MRKRKEIEYVVSERIVKQYFVKYKDQHPEKINGYIKMRFRKKYLKNI